MLLYAIKRLLRSLISIVFIICIVFTLLRFMPVEGYFPTNYDRMTQLELDTILEQMGLKDPIHVQITNFFKQLLQGDLGTSIRYRVNYPIVEIVKQKAPISLKFGLSAMAISLPLGMILGVLMARKKGGFWDLFGTGYIVLMQAIPMAVFSILIQLFGTSLLRIPMLYDPDKPATMFLPIFTLSLSSISGYALWLRRYMVDESNKDYIKLARAKGVPEKTIFIRHVFRNSIVPLVQSIPGSLLLTIAGSIYVESIYSIPGMGGLLVDVIKRQDNPMVQAIVIIYSVLGIFGLLLGDLLMAIVDPRIKLVKKEGLR